MKMTYKDFLKAVKDSGERWTLLDGGEIRRASCKTCCPWLVISILLNDPDHEHYNPSFSVEIEGGDTRIWDAADKRGRHSKKVRRDLLRACGLVEEV